MAALEFAHSFERLTGGLEVCISPEHGFGTDAFLLSHFAAPRRRDRAADLGAGCGIVAFLWFRQPQLAPREVYGVDIQPQAVAQMEETVRRAGLEGRFHPVCSDLTHLHGQVPFGALDLVACNPPYKAAGRGIQSQGTSRLVARHETLCTLEQICAAAGKLLQTGGRFCLCQRPERLADAMEGMRRAKLEPKRLRFVQKRGDTAPWLFLLEGRKCAGSFLKVEQPLIVEDENGDFSPELRRIYWGEDGSPPNGQTRKP